VLSGGADNGAYQAGAIKALAEARELADLVVVTGTSAGAINAAGLCQWPAKQLVDASAWLVDMWSTQMVGPNSVRRHRFPPYLAAMWKPSLYTTGPLRDLLRRLVDVQRIRASGIEVRVTATSLETGKLCIFNQNDPAFLDCVLASASIPLAFEPVEIRGELFVDGFLDTAPLAHAIKIGASRIIVIVAQNRATTKPASAFHNAFAVVNRAIELYGDETLTNDLRVCERVNMDIAGGTRRDGRRRVLVTVIEPSQPLGDSTDFDPRVAKKNIEMGYNDAMKVVRAS
jgi:NTE family protein